MQLQRVTSETKIVHSDISQFCVLRLLISSSEEMGYS